MAIDDPRVSPSGRIWAQITTRFASRMTSTNGRQSIELQVARSLCVFINSSLFRRRIIRSGARSFFSGLYERYAERQAFPLGRRSARNALSRVPLKRSSAFVRLSFSRRLLFFVSRFKGQQLVAIILVFLPPRVDLRRKTRA